MKEIHIKYFTDKIDTISSSQSKEGILYSPQVSGSTLVSFAARYATS